MSRINAKDCRMLRAAPEEVYRALLDFDGYRNWWPASMPLRVVSYEAGGVGSRAVLRAAGGQFSCEIVSALPERQITLRCTGLHKGAGTWTIEPEGDGSYVVFELNVEVQGRLARLLSHVVSFRRLHANLMQDVFRALETHLNRTRKQDNLVGV